MRKIRLNCCALAAVACISGLSGCGGGVDNTSGGSSGADTVAPLVTIATPTTQSNYTATGATVTLTGNATDAVGVTQVSWSNSRGGAGSATVGGTATGATWSTGAVALQSGTNVISITARDAAGNAGSDTLIVNYGTTTSTTYYISPTGNDAYDGSSTAQAWKSFAHAFSSMSGGDELILLDGTYSEANGTGYISYLGTGSAQPPTGIDKDHPTFVHALNPGSVTVTGALFIGRSTRKDSHIRIQGVTFEGGGQLYNTSYVTMKDCGFHGAFIIGTNDHDNGNEYNLVEDSWIWASGERIIAINYRALHNVWRRVLVRGDGCGTASCTGSGSPNVGITVYNSSDVSIQNVMVVDRVLSAGDSPYADFAVAQHAPGPEFGRAEWLGTLSLNAPDSGYYMEPDNGGTVDPTIKISNAVAWNAAEYGFNIARTGTNNLLENLTVSAVTGNGVRVAPELSGGTLRNVIVAASVNWGINSAYAPSYVDVVGGSYNQTTCATGCYTSDPRSDGAPASLRYITRIETGSFLKGRGFGGSDIGANILYRYGTDGSRFGEAGYNTLTSASLWPWPNEYRIKQEMCAATTRGFCATGTRRDGVNPITLTSYIWEALGNALPAGIYP